MLSSKMSISKEILIDIEEKADRLRKLLERENIMKCIYKSYGTITENTIEIEATLLSMDKMLEKLLLQQTGNSPNKKLLGMLSSIKLMLSVNRLNEVDADGSCAGEKYLNRCQEIISGHENEPEIVFPALAMHYQFALRWLPKVPRKCQSHLETAEKYFILFKESGQAPIHTDELFKYNLKSYNAALGRTNLEDIYTMIVTQLANVHDVLGNSVKLLLYGHETLKRQLENQELKNDPIWWVRDCATLSLKFVKLYAYKQARHHLAACTYMLEEYEKKLNTSTRRNDAHNIEVNNLKCCSADVAVAWADYGLTLMICSTDLLKKEVVTPPENLNQLHFSSLNLQMYEEKVTHNLLLTFEDAKSVFLNVQHWLKKAELHYSIDNASTDTYSDYISDSMKVIQMHSNAYHLLKLYEKNLDNEAKLNKRAINILEKLKLRINPTVFTDCYRDVQYLLAHRYLDMVSVKVCKLKETPVTTPGAIEKINSFVQKGINNFTYYIDSYLNNQNKLPMTDDKTFDHQKFVLAYINIAILNSQFVTSDINEKLKNCEAAINAYNKVNEYIKQNPNVAQHFASKLDLMQKDLILLQVRQALLRQRVLSHK